MAIIRKREQMHTPGESRNTNWAPLVVPVGPYTGCFGAFCKTWVAYCSQHVLIPTQVQFNSPLLPMKKWQSYPQVHSTGPRIA